MELGTELLEDFLRIASKILVNIGAIFRMGVRGYPDSAIGHRRSM
jgi:hypothetical protein